MVCQQQQLKWIASQYICELENRPNSRLHCRFQGKAAGNEQKNYTSEPSLSRAKCILKMHQKHTEVAYCDNPNPETFLLEQIQLRRYPCRSKTAEPCPGSYQQFVTATHAQINTTVAPCQLQWLNHRRKQGGECAQLQVQHESISCQSAYSAQTVHGLPSERR